MAKSCFLKNDFFENNPVSLHRSWIEAQLSDRDQAYISKTCRRHSKIILIDQPIFSPPHKAVDVKFWKLLTIFDNEYITVFTGLKNRQLTGKILNTSFWGRADLNTSFWGRVDIYTFEGRIDIYTFEGRIDIYTFEGRVNLNTSYWGKIGAKTPNEIELFEQTVGSGDLACWGPSE